MNGIVQCNYIEIYNRDMFDKLFKFNAIMITHTFYQLDSHRSIFGHNKIQLTNTSHHKNLPDA